MLLDRFKSRRATALSDQPSLEDTDKVDEKASELEGSYIRRGSGSLHEEREKGRSSSEEEDEPVITTGIDVSKYVVDIRDDGDSALTFRSLVLGTVFAGLGSALCQVSERETRPFVFWMCGLINLGIDL
jgi:hypothetical protein